MKLRLALIGAGAAGILALSAGSALAIVIPGTPDAAQTTHDHNLVPQTTLAQTFVPTISGSLGTVEVFTTVQVPPAVVPAAATDITVEIRTTSSNLPTSTVLATQTLAPGNGAWTVVSFSSPTNVVAGTMYAIVVTNGASSFAEWDAACANPYGPGVAYILDGTWKTIPTFDDASCISDFAFQSFIVTAAATPGPTAPPTSTAGDTTGDAPSNPSFLLIFAGLAAAASAAVYVKVSRRHLTQQ